MYGTEKEEEQRVATKEEYMYTGINLSRFPRLPRGFLPTATSALVLKPNMYAFITTNCWLQYTMTYDFYSVGDCGMLLMLFIIACRCGFLTR